MTKGDLAEKAVVRPATISALINSDTPPEVATLQKIADVFKVDLWEFFVSDEQAGLLRVKRQQHDALIAEEEVSARIERRVMERLAGVIHEETAAEISGVPPKIQAVVPPRRKRAAR